MLDEGQFTLWKILQPWLKVYCFHGNLFESLRSSYFIQQISHRLSLIGNFPWNSYLEICTVIWVRNSIHNSCCASTSATPNDPPSQAKWQAYHTVFPRVRALPNRLVKDTTLIVYVQALDGRNQEKPFAIGAAKLIFRQNISFLHKFSNNCSSFRDQFLNKHPRLMEEIILLYNWPEPHFRLQWKYPLNFASLTVKAAGEDIKGERLKIYCHSL